MGSSSEDRQVRPPEAGNGDPQVSPADRRDPPAANRVALVAAWLAGSVVCSAGLFMRFAEPSIRSPEWMRGISADAPAFLILLALAPPLWWLQRRSKRPRKQAGWRARHFGFQTRPGERAGRAGIAAWSAACAVSLLSIAVSFAVSQMHIGGDALRFGDLPPAYHDEYSYLFQAKTFLAGRTWFPPHPQVPQFFDQMHVLNDNGRYASRYFPGTGAWLAPFVALGHPLWGQWLAGGLAAFFVFWTGREIGGNGVGLLAGLLTAVSPGMALFSNLLLAHHPTLVGLSVFLYAFLRMLRTRSVACAGAAGCGLAFAMLCRPMTAAGFAFAFGVWFVVWLWRRPGHAANRRWVATLAAMALPLAAGFVVLFLYNRSITGSGWQTPYAVYEEIYTPRHRYGFYNADRGALHAGPKVLTAYDEWAENLTPRLAVRNVGRRLLASWEWSLGVIPLVMAAVAVPFCVIVARRRGWFDARWWLVPAAIFSLHVAHVPYWFTGILHWHYVFESGPLWLLVVAGVSVCVAGALPERGGFALSVWWLGIGVLGVAAAWLPRTWIDPFAGAEGQSVSRVRAAVAELAYSRLKHERIQHELDRRIPEPSAIVFVDPKLESVHIEHVINDPQLSAPILRGRLLADEFQNAGVLAAFPDRSAWWVVTDEQLQRRILRGGFADYGFEYIGNLQLREPQPVELWRVRPR